jgi:hypothetical protein
MSRFTRRICTAVQLELDAARDADVNGDPGRAFHHLERAHVLGQASTVEHVRVHWRMFTWGLRQRKPREVAGQVWRLIGAVLVTGIGWLPEGNTGGANVSGLRPMPVPDDLQRLIDAARQ